MKMTKKLITLALAALMLLSLAVPAVAADDVITKATVKKTNIKADYVENLGGFGYLYMESDAMLVLSQVALIDKTGKAVFKYQKSYYNYFYDPDSGIISYAIDFPYYNGWEYYSYVYGEEAANVYPVYYNTDGSVAFSLPPQGNTHYDEGPMKNGRAVVIEYTGSGSNIKKSLYVVDKTGKKVFSIPDATTPPDSDGYVDWKKMLLTYSDGLALYSEYIPNDEGKWNTIKYEYLDTAGKTAFDLTGYEEIPVFSEGLAPIRRNNKNCYIDKSGKVVLSLDKDCDTGSFHNGLACVDFVTETADGKIEFKSSYIDKTGKTVLVSKYDLAYEAGDGLFTALLLRPTDYKYGLINIKDEVVVPFEYDYISTFEYGAAYAIKDGYVYVITADKGAPTTPAATSFSDVPAKAWFAEPVAWAVEKGITNGTSKTTFSPNNTCNNSEILTFLWRACGKPTAPDAGFSDVASGAWYADAANWAKSKDMVSGDKLSPTQPCTRASAVMFIWQAMGKPAASKAASFTDVPANADYAAAVAWAVEKGVTNGTGADTFSPGTICTRAQIVAFLQRAYAE